MKTTWMRWACATALSIGPFALSAQDTTAFVDVNVIPMDRQAVLPHRVVLVARGAVVAVASQDSIVVPRSARRIEGNGTSYLLPGLVDSHVHLEIDERRWLPVFLASGVTTVINLRGEARHLTLRDDVAAGRVVGPSILTAGRYANMPLITTPEEAAAEVQSQRAAGYDLIKIHGNLTGPAFARLADESRRVGIPLVGHAPRNLAFDSVIANRQTMVAHVEELLYTHYRRAGDTAGTGALGARMRTAGVWLTPNLVAYSLIARQIGRPEVIDSLLRLPESRMLDSAMRQLWRGGMYTNRPLPDAPAYERNRVFLFDVTAGLHAAGVRMLAGTDTPLPGIYPGKSLLDELDLLVVAGLSRFEALATATRNAGEFIGTQVRKDVRVGTVSAGARADLVLLAGNPLDDFGTLRKPLGVMAAGRWYSSDDLNRLLAALVR
jgi:hypothetical protein